MTWSEANASSGREPCDRGAGGISHCNGTQFVCNNGTVSGSRKICSSLSIPGLRNFVFSRRTHQATVPAIPSQPKPAPTNSGHAGFKNCRQFFATTPPSLSRAKLRELCYDNFAILHSGETKTPVFVAERLNRDGLTAGENIPRSDDFFADSRLPANERAELDDYANSGYDRGHQSPARDQNSATAMAQSFSLANVVPQAPKNNSHAWASIESATRKYVMRAHGDVFVITGPVFAPSPATIGRNRVAVPSFLFKLVYDPSTNRAWAHWLENNDDARVGRPITYEALSQRIGVALLPGIRPEM